jgi:hypothetical protein
MAKKDLGIIKEDIERDNNDGLSLTEKSNEQPSTGTEVKNAHASGLGSMGHTDESQADHSMDQAPGKPGQEY